MDRGGSGDARPPSTRVFVLREDYDYGRFAWIMDLDGNRIELWEPPKDAKE